MGGIGCNAQEVNGFLHSTPQDHATGLHRK
jgi:hypothetical protein